MEQIIFQLANIQVQFLDKDILAIDQLHVHQFDRIGIVGKNGVGKSTLLDVLAGKIKPAKGHILGHVDTAYFKQVERPAESTADGAMLSKLGVSDVGRHASGGEKTRLKLAQLFSRYHEAMLLDEPTTHLDEEGISFLINELEYYYGALIMVSHNRQFLDDVVSTIWEIKDGKVAVYKGNYTAYEAAKKEEKEKQLHKHAGYMKEKARLQKAASLKKEQAHKLLETNAKGKQKAKEKPSRLGKSKSKGTSQKGIYRAAKDIETQMERLEKVETYKEDEGIVFRQSEALKLHNKFPIMGGDLTLSAGERILLENVRFQLPLGKKIAITGPNGSGKSTLLEHIMCEGEGITLSPKVEIGRFRQMSYQFASDRSLLDFMKSEHVYPEAFIRSVLDKMQFSGTDLRKRVRSLSGGEAMRLQLCRLFLSKYNILLLDEPTNFLDIQALDALETFIHGYEGTVVFVTHDRRFIERVADLCYLIDPVSRTFEVM